MKNKEEKYSPRRKQKLHYEDNHGKSYSIEDTPEKESHYRRKKGDKNILTTETNMSDSDKWEKGIVIEVSRKTIKVLIKEVVYDCVIGGNFMQKNETVVATGDFVQVENLNNDNWIIRKVLPRLTRLSRPAATGTKLSMVKEKIIAANIDVLGIVVATLKPVFKPALIDRYLLTAEKHGISVLIIMNKIDLTDKIPESIHEYEKLGIKVIYTSTITNQGIDELKEALKDKICVFTGHSGVGKSSLLNSLSSELNLKTSSVGSGEHCWKHTTRKSTLYKLDNNGIVIDTPGIRELGVWGIAPEQLSWYFPEFHEPAEDCKFTNCSHDHEPKCKVKELVELGQISKMRYDSYLRVYHSLRENLQ